MAIKAFDAEIATISHSVKTPEAAAIRYEFWRSALQRVKANKDFEGHPLVESLAKANLSSNQIYWLEQSLEARASSLDRRIFSLSDLDEYAHKSLVQILWTINSIAKEPKNTGEFVAVEHALDHLGKAQLTVRRLKGLAKALSSKNSLAEQFIPTGLLGKSGMNGPKMVESTENEKFKDLVHEMASHAHSHLSLIAPETEKTDLFLSLSKYSCNRYLSALQQHNFSILAPKIWGIGSQQDGLLPIKLYFKSIF